MSGFIALHREAFTHPVLKDADRFRAWFWLVAHAAWKQTRHDARGRTIIVERGQLCAGREQLAKEWKWSPSAVERFLTRLETEQMIERQTGQGKSVITICNYDKYQDSEPETGHLSGQQTGQKSDRNRTTKEQGNKGTSDEEANASPSQPRKQRGGVSVRPDDIPEPLWDAWVKHRGKHRADAGPTTIAAYRREAEGVGWTLEQALTEQISRGWRGFKAKWVKDDDRANPIHHSSGSTGQARDNRDGFARALDRRLGLEGTSGPIGRSDTGEGGGYRQLPPAAA